MRGRGSFKRFVCSRKAWLLIASGVVPLRHNNTDWGIRGLAEERPDTAGRQTVMDTIRKPIDRRTLFGATFGGAALLAAGANMAAGCGEAVAVESDATVSLAELNRGGTWLGSPEIVDDAQVVQELEADVVVVGGGLAGVSTAVSALENGLSVIVLEKNEQPRAVGLDFGCVNPTIAMEAGLGLSDDEIYQLVRDWTHMATNRVRVDIIKKFVDNSGAAVDWIAEKAEKWGCRPVLAQMKSESDTYFNYTRTVEFPDGPLYDIAAGSFGCNDIIAMLRKCIEGDASGQYIVKTPARYLEKDESGAVVAAIAQAEDGSYLRCRATKGIALCAGDFGANERMVAELTTFDPSSLDNGTYINASTGQGDGQRMGLWVGGVMQEGPQPLMLLPQTYPYFYLHVNDRGERFCNEDCDSVSMCVNQLTQHGGNAWSVWDAKWPEEIPASLEVSGGMSWDQDFREYGQPWSREAEQATFDYDEMMGMLFVCDTLEELAERMGVDAERFTATVARYNELAAKGVDEDFGKRRELMTTIEQGPFYALRMQTDLCVSVGGLQVNVDSQVLDETNAPIEGLYAVGNNAGGLFGVDYNEAPVPGVSLGRCVTFGKLLGEYLAAK